MGFEKKKLVDLNDRNVLVDTDLFHVVSSGLDYKTQNSTIRDYMFDDEPAKVIKYQATIFGGMNTAVASSVMPLTNSKPSRLQGILVTMTNVFIPVSTSNKLIVKTLLNGSAVTGGVHLTCAIYDAIPGDDYAVAAATRYSHVANSIIPIHLTHIINPPIDPLGVIIYARLGSTVAGQLTNNGINGGQIFDGALQSYIEIYEIVT